VVDHRVAVDDQHQLEHDREGGHREGEQVEPPGPVHARRLLGQRPASSSASAFAFVLSRFPPTWTEPSVTTPLKLAALSTRPSTTIASSCPESISFRDSLASTRVPSAPSW